MPAIYTLCDPITGEVRYLGMSRNPAYRLRQYKARTGGHTKHLRNWLESVGRNPTQIILETVAAEVADQREREWIALLREYGTNLINYTDGGEGGFTHPPEVVARIRSAQEALLLAGTHNFQRPEVRALATEKARQGKGRKAPWSVALAKRMSEAQRGRKLTPEHRRKCSEALKGRPVSEQLRQAIGKRTRALWADPVWAAKTRAALTGISRDFTGIRAAAAKRQGIPLSAAHRAAVSAAMKGRRNSGLAAYWEARKNDQPGGRQTTSTSHK